MGLGYILGCLFSILLRKIDKFKILESIYYKLKKIIKSDIFFFAVIILFFIIFKLVFIKIPDEEIKNFITFIICIDISNTEFVNLNIKGNKHFYNSISTITKAIVGGFVGPIFYTLLFGNYFAIFYYLLFLVNDIAGNKIINITVRLLNIIPAFLAGIIFYFIYAFKNKTLYIDFKGDFLINSIFNPLLNLNIIAANLESVNFYYLKGSCDIKSYVNGKHDINIICIKEFLNHTYFVCLVNFLAFITLKTINFL